MQIVSYGDNLHEMSKPIFWKKKKIRKIFQNVAAEILPSMLSINVSNHWLKMSPKNMQSY